MPGWQLALMIRRAGLTQFDIAETANDLPGVGRVNQSDVSKAIHRRNRHSPNYERIWTALVTLLAPKSNGSGGRA